MFSTVVVGAAFTTRYSVIWISVQFVEQQIEAHAQLSGELSKNPREEKSFGTNVG